MNRFVKHGGFQELSEIVVRGYVRKSIKDEKIQYTWSYVHVNHPTCNYIIFVRSCISIAMNVPLPCSISASSQHTEGSQQVPYHWMFLLGLHERSPCLLMKSHHQRKYSYPLVN